MFLRESIKSSSPKSTHCSGLVQKRFPIKLEDSSLVSCAPPVSILCVLRIPLHALWNVTNTPASSGCRRWVVFGGKYRISTYVIISSYWCVYSDYQEKVAPGVLLSLKLMRYSWQKHLKPWQKVITIHPSWFTVSINCCWTTLRPLLIDVLPFIQDKRWKLPPSALSAHCDILMSRSTCDFMNNLYSSVCYQLLGWNRGTKSGFITILKLSCSSWIFRI